MTLGNGPDSRTAGHDSGASPASWGLLGFAVQVVGALVFWVIADEWAGRGWSTRDFREWMKFSIALTVALAGLGGVVTRRWRNTLTVMMGCLLAVALGCVLFIAYALVNSA